jgi:hypothetical protein
MQARCIHPCTHQLSHCVTSAILVLQPCNEGRRAGQRFFNGFVCEAMARTLRILRIRGGASMPPSIEHRCRLLIRPYLRGAPLPPPRCAAGFFFSRRTAQWPLPHCHRRLLFLFCARTCTSAW